MKNRLLILIFAFVANLVAAQTFEWGKGLGGDNIDFGVSIKVDDMENVYTMGNFVDTADFDPGAGIYKLIDYGHQSIFITKLDSAGDFIWAKQIGDTDTAAFDSTYIPGSATASSITIDNNGYIYVAGSFLRTIDADPGLGTYYLTSDTFYTAGATAFIIKLDTSGNFVWAKTFGGGVHCTVWNCYNSIYPCEIEVDMMGNIYSTGIFQGTIDMDPNFGSYNLISAGNWDAFNVKLDAAGNFVWAKSTGGSLEDWSYSIEVDDIGNVYTAGCFYGISDFDPNNGIYNLVSAGSSDIFISKLDVNGDLVWAKSIGGTGHQKAYRIALDNYGNVYTTGYSYGTADFDPNVGTFYLTDVTSDCFISKLDTAGNFVWAKSFDGSNISNSASTGTGILTDAFGNVYTTGFFYQTVDFDPNSGIHDLITGTQMQIFLSKLDATGSFVWAKSIGGLSRDYVNTIAMDTSENSIYLSGEFEYTTDFDPPNGANLTSNGNKDAYIAKYNQCQMVTNSSYTTCDSYTWNGNTYTTSGTYSFTTTNATGCDSISTLILTINHSNSSTIAQTACDNYTWNGNTYTTSGTYSFTTTNATGCDSIATLILTINHSNSSTIAQTACDNYTWNGNTYTTSGTYSFTTTNATGCDSIATLILTINHSNTSNTIQTACDSYTWNGNTYTTNGAYTFNTINATGCDSIATLVLNINTVNSSITQNATSLTANATNATYQWLDCNGNTPISGETNQTFTPITNGNYAVIVTENNCSDTSVCYLVTGLGVLENSFGSGFKLYPNPTKGNVNIELGAQFPLTEVLIFNALGQEVGRKTYLDTGTLTLQIAGESGLYFLHIKAGEKEATVRVVKE